MAVGHADVRTTQGYTEKLSDEEMQRKFWFTKRENIQNKSKKPKEQLQDPIRASRNR